MGNDNWNRRASKQDGDGRTAKQFDERQNRERDEKRANRGQEDEQGKSKKIHLSRKTVIIGGIVVGLILIGVFLYWLHGRNFVSTDDAYTTAHVHEISARVDGTVETVNVNDNEPVKAGQALVGLDRRDFKVAAEQARALVMQRHAAADQAQANQTHAQQDYDRFTKLGSEKVVSKQDVDNATAALKAANGALNAAKSDLVAAEAASKNAELQLSYTAIIAPTDGLIAKKTVETGARVQPGQALMAVVEQDVWVLGNFKETQIPRMRVGQDVKVKIDAIPDHLFRAHIDSLQPGTGSTFALLPPDNATGNFVKIVQRVPVKIVFDDVGNYRNRVVPGLSCEPKVDLRTGPKQ